MSWPSTAFECDDIARDRSGLFSPPCVLFGNDGISGGCMTRFLHSGVCLREEVEWYSDIVVPDNTGLNTAVQHNVRDFESGEKKKGTRVAHVWSLRCTCLPPLRGCTYLRLDRRPSTDLGSMFLLLLLRKPESVVPIRSFRESMQALPHMLCFWDSNEDDDGATAKPIWYNIAGLLQEVVQVLCLRTNPLDVGRVHWKKLPAHAHFVVGGVHDAVCAVLGVLRRVRPGAEGRKRTLSDPVDWCQSDSTVAYLVRQEHIGIKAAADHAKSSRGRMTGVGSLELPHTHAAYISTTDPRYRGSVVEWTILLWCFCHHLHFHGINDLDSLARAVLNDFLKGEKGRSLFTNFLTSKKKKKVIE